MVFRDMGKMDKVQESTITVWDLVKHKWFKKADPLIDSYTIQGLMELWFYIMDLITSLIKKQEI